MAAIPWTWIGDSTVAQASDAGELCEMMFEQAFPAAESCRFYDAIEIHERASRRYMAPLGL